VQQSVSGVSSSVQASYRVDWTGRATRMEVMPTRFRIRFSR
jgi:hypothetical protein